MKPFFYHPPSPHRAGRPAAGHNQCSGHNLYPLLPVQKNCHARHHFNVSRSYHAKQVERKQAQKNHHSSGCRRPCLLPENTQIRPEQPSLQACSESSLFSSQKLPPLSDMRAGSTLSQSSHSIPPLSSLFSFSVFQSSETWGRRPGYSWKLLNEFPALSNSLRMLKEL